MGTTASSTAMSASDDRNNYLSSSEPSAAYQQTPNDITKEYIPSYCKVFGKDKVIFLSKDDWEKPPRDLPDGFLSSLDGDDKPRGVVLPSGDINWGCPCLGNLSYGPCAVPFRDAFSCFHYSLADPKGSDCIEYFRDMTECMQRYPNLYPQDDGDDEEGEDAFSAIDKAEKQAAEEKRKSI